MRLYVGTFCRCERGVLSIEFAATFMIFLSMFLLMMEVARLSYISAVLNLGVSEAAKIAKNTRSSDSAAYQALFIKELTENRGKLWNFITRADALKAKVCFSKDIESLVHDINRGGDNSAYCVKNAAGRPLGRYVLEYTYHSLFFPLPADSIQTILRKEVTFVQEHS